MTESQFDAISVTLIDTLRESINAVLAAAGYPADWSFEGEMSTSLAEFAGEVLAWVGGATVEVAPVLPMAA